MNANDKITKWKSEETESMMQYIARQEVQIAEWKAQLGYGGMCQLADYQRISKAVKDLVRMSEKSRRTEVEKLIDKHFDRLQAKVESRIGKIVEITTIGDNGMDYIFRGEIGNCQIKVVNAGGWNIQAAHTRWTFAKIK